MSKLSNNTALDQLHEENIWSEEWEDYVHWMHTWVDVVGEECSWQWYIAVDRYTREGWRHIKINPMHKDITVRNWLTEQGATYKSEHEYFLIKEEEWAMMAALKWA